MSKILTIANKVHFYFGSTDRWGFGFTYSNYDRALTIEIIHWYITVEVWDNK